LIKNNKIKNKKFHINNKIVTKNKDKILAIEDKKGDKNHHKDLVPVKKEDKKMNKIINKEYKINHQDLNLK
jgi:hypothetical protein